jgi:hypothetical protein
VRLHGTVNGATKQRQKTFGLTSRLIQGDQKISAHLMITVQKQTKNILNSVTYHDNVVKN